MSPHHASRRHPGAPQRIQAARPRDWVAALIGVLVLQFLLLAGLSWRRPSAPPESAAPILIELEREPGAPASAEPQIPDDAPPGDAPGDAGAAPAPAARAGAAPTPARRASPSAPDPVPAAPRPSSGLAAAASPAPDLPLIGGAALAGALRSGGGSGSGAGGGECDMAARLETALRRDNETRRAVADVLAARGAPGQAVLVWDGDWLQSPGQEGKGLAGVRQAVAVEVGFAPRACRDQTVHGLVAIALDDAPDGPRLALGAARWRWRDLLGL